MWYRLDGLLARSQRCNPLARSSSTLCASFYILPSASQHEYRRYSLFTRRVWYRPNGAFEAVTAVKSACEFVEYPLCNLSYTVQCFTHEDRRYSLFTLRVWYRLNRLFDERLITQSACQTVEFTLRYLIFSSSHVHLSISPYVSHVSLLCLPYSPPWGSRVATLGVDFGAHNPNPHFMCGIVWTVSSMRSQQ